MTRRRHAHLRLVYDADAPPNAVVSPHVHPPAAADERGETMLERYRREKREAEIEFREAMYCQED